MIFDESCLKLVATLASIFDLSNLKMKIQQAKGGSSHWQPFVTSHLPYLMSFYAFLNLWFSGKVDSTLLKNTSESNADGNHEMASNPAKSSNSLQPLCPFAWHQACD